MKTAVFLDRDGVITELVPNPVTGDFEPPKAPGEVALYAGVIDSLHALQAAGYDLFLVSNQPDHAKGKASLEGIRAVHEVLDRILRSEGIRFREYYYCYHHPDGVVPGYSVDCECRKPKPYFLLLAAEIYGIDLGRSWMIGDRDTDIACGKSAGVRTILVETPGSAKNRGSSEPDYKTANLKEAVQIIVSQRV